MFRSPARPERRPIIVALSATALLVALAGCSAEGPAEPTSSPAATETDAPDATGSPSATEAPETPAITPYAIACDQVLSADQVYAFNPNYGTAPDYEPSGSTIALAVQAGGTACGWTNQTSGALIEIAVAKPGEQALESAANRAAGARTAVPTYGTPPAVEGFFSASGSAGTAEVVTGPYWIVVESTELFEPGDAAPLVEAVLANLPTE